MITNVKLASLYNKFDIETNPDKIYKLINEIKEFEDLLYSKIDKINTEKVYKEIYEDFKHNQK